MPGSGLVGRGCLCLGGGRRCSCRRTGSEAGLGSSRPQRSRTETSSKEETEPDKKEGGTANSTDNTERSGTVVTASVSGADTPGGQRFYPMY